MNDNINFSKTTSSKKIPSFNKFLLFGQQPPSADYFTIVPFFTDSKKQISEIFAKNTGDLTFTLDQKKIYISLGSLKKFNLQTARSVFAELVTQPQTNIHLDLTEFGSQQLKNELLLENFLIVFFRLRHTSLTYKKKKKSVPKVYSISVHTPINPDLCQEILQRTTKKIAAVNLASDWQDTPPNLLTSESFATIIQKKWASKKEIKLKILDKNQIINEKMNLFLAVNQGSHYQPRLIVAEYHPLPKNPVAIVFIGKGVMFDTGGYSLKPSQYQKDMKFDMSGAANVLALFDAVVAAKLLINLVVITPLTDNLVDAKAILVESVITAKDGQTVEITNTDAEGRLILADAISYARLNYQPKMMIELSTLTGAISVALGRETTGAFSNKPQIFTKLTKIAADHFEPICYLPVTKENFQRMKDSRIADLINASGSYQAGASNAAAFLFSFANKTPFLHLDIGGTAYTKNSRGRGIMIQSLFEFCRLEAEKE